jgi:hypothetical protein
MYKQVDELGLQASLAVFTTAAHSYAAPQHAGFTVRYPGGEIGFSLPRRGGVMQDAGYELRMATTAIATSIANSRNVFREPTPPTTTHHVYASCLFSGIGNHENPRFITSYVRSVAIS